MHQIRFYPSERTITRFVREKKLNKRNMTVMKLTNDASFTNWEGMDSYLIDDDHDTFGHSANFLHCRSFFHLDLGQVAKLPYCDVPCVI